MIINHPKLGPRDSGEFIIKGDASLIERPDALPSETGETLKPFHDYVYLRDNPRGVHRELWYHEHGDRSWLVVTRDTLSHEILKVECAEDFAKERGR